MRKVVYLSVLVLSVFGVVNFLSAMDVCCAAEHKDTSKTAQDKGEAIDVGNKICPVSGEKIDEKTKATYEYEGKIYNFCCSGCINGFKKNPEKYIKIIEEEGTKEGRSHEHLMH